MKSYNFIKRYFHSEKELMDFREREYRDINTLFSYLTNLHSLSDKLRNNFDISLSVHPEFKILRILRNYFHHVDDIDEIRLFANLNENIIVHHIEQLVIPMQVWAKAVNNFISKNTVPKNRRDYKKKQSYIKKELNKILEICDCDDLFKNPSLYCKPLKLKCDGCIVELGFDIFKFVYNVSNIIADKCRNIDELSIKLLDLTIDDHYTERNNIPKSDIGSHAGTNIILTTEGYLFPSVVESAL